MLSIGQRREFFDRGWTVLPDLFSGPEMDRIALAFDRLERLARGLAGTGTHEGSLFVIEGSRIHRIVWCGGAEPALAEIGRDARLLQPAARLLGSRRMVQLLNQAHFKLPGDGVEFPWHQDSEHRRYGGDEWRDVNGRGSFVQTVLAVDDVTADNGPIEFIPGSCRLGHVARDAPGEWPPTRLGVDPVSSRAVTMARGSVLLFGPYVFHRSSPNRSRSPRRVLINGFAYPGANGRSYPGVGRGRIVWAA